MLMIRAFTLRIYFEDFSFLKVFSILTRKLGNYNHLIAWPG